MVKERKYDLLNKEYFYGISALFREFSEKKIPAVLVGGAAVQAKIASLASNGRPLNEVQGLENLLRKTDDFDISTVATDQQVIDFLKNIDGKYDEAVGNNIYNLKIDRMGLKKPKIIVERAGENDYSDSLISLNIENSPRDLLRLDEKYYETIINNSETLDLENSGIKASIKVAKPEYLIAAKSLRFADRDREDIYNLTKAMKESNSKINWYGLKIIGPYNIDRIGEIKTLLRGDQ